VNAFGLAPGEYQGYLQVSAPRLRAWRRFRIGSRSPVPLRRGLRCSYRDSYDSARTVSYGAVVFRIVDIAGLPYTGSLTPQIAMTTGGGSIRSAYHAGDIPGTYAVDIRAGTSTMQLNISIAGMTQTVLIGVN